jgi:hypothetical protein
VGGYAARAPEGSVRPRRRSGGVARPLNFTVRWQVQHDTLLVRTRQWWKLRLATVGVVISLVVQFVPRLAPNGAMDRDLMFYTVVSTLLAAGSLVVLFWGIRCPHCGAKWAQSALRQPSGRWLHWLRDLQACPKCGSNGSLPPNNRWRGP